MNIKNLSALKWGSNKEVGLRKALKILNKELVGQHHNALDDALNTTEILKAWSPSAKGLTPWEAPQEPINGRCPY